MSYMGAVGSIFGLNAVIDNGAGHITQPVSDVGKAAVYNTNPCVSVCATAFACVFMLFCTYGLLVGLQLLLGGSL